MGNQILIQTAFQTTVLIIYLSMYYHKNMHKYNAKIILHNLENSCCNYSSQNELNYFRKYNTSSLKDNRFSSSKCI